MKKEERNMSLFGIFAPHKKGYFQKAKKLQSAIPCIVDVLS